MERIRGGEDGMTICRMARKARARMGGDFGVKRLALDLYFEVGPTEPNLRLGDPQDIADAFGVDRDFFLNLERAWLAALARKETGG